MDIKLIDTKELEDGSLEITLESSIEIWNLIVKVAKVTKGYPKFRGRGTRSKAISWLINYSLREYLKANEK